MKTINMKTIKSILLVGFIFTQFAQIQMAEAGFFDFLFRNNIRIAAGEGDVDRVKSILDAGADVNATDKDYDWTGLFVSDGRTALHHAAYWGHLEVVELLLECGADVNVIDNSGNTALHYATHRDKTEIVKLLNK